MSHKHGHLWHNAKRLTQSDHVHWQCTVVDAIRKSKAIVNHHLSLKIRAKTLGPCSWHNRCLPQDWALELDAQCYKHGCNTSTMFHNPYPKTALILCKISCCQPFLVVPSTSELPYLSSWGMPVWCSVSTVVPCSGSSSLISTCQVSDSSCSMTGQQKDVGSADTDSTLQVHSLRYVEGFSLVCVCLSCEARMWCLGVCLSHKSQVRADHWCDTRKDMHKVLVRHTTMWHARIALRWLLHTLSCIKPIRHTWAQVTSIHYKLQSWESHRSTNKEELQKTCRHLYCQVLNCDWLNNSLLQ